MWLLRSYARQGRKWCEVREGRARQWARKKGTEGPALAAAPLVDEKDERVVGPGIWQTPPRRRDSSQAGAGRGERGEGPDKTGAAQPARGHRAAQAQAESQAAARGGCKAPALLPVLRAHEHGPGLELRQPLLGVHELRRRGRGSGGGG